MPDAGERTRDQHWRKRGGGDEARRIGTDHVDDVAIGRDIAAHHAERLAERPFDDGKAARRVVTIRYAAAPRAVHADRMRSEEHTSELQSLMRISYDGFCLKKKNIRNTNTNQLNLTNCHTKQLCEHSI